MVNVPMTVLGGFPFEMLGQYGPPATTGAGVATGVSGGAVSTGCDSPESLSELLCGFATVGVLTGVVTGDVDAEGEGVSVGVDVALTVGETEGVAVCDTSLVAETRLVFEASRL